MPSLTRIDASAIRIVGHCPWTTEQVKVALEEGVSPADLPGDCVITGRGTDAEGEFETILSSALCCQNYYTAKTPSGLVHGPNLFSLVRRGRLGWRWNERSLLSLLTAEFTTDTDTLHAQVERLRPATRVVCRGTRSSERTYPFWETVFAGRPSSMGEAAEVLRDVVRESATSETALSLSAGFDSRVILAILVSLGIQPVVGTMGFAESTDVVVASAMARHYGLQHRRVVLEPEDYLRYAASITEVCGGSKTADHWHTYIYIKKVGFSPHTLHWAGSNGEFARTTWFDRNPLTRIVGRLGLRVAERIIRRRFSHGPYSARFHDAMHLLPEPLGGFSVRDVPEHFVSLLRGQKADLNRLDEFIALNPTRHFIGNGVSLYRSVVGTHSPFLDHRWISRAARLARRARVGSNFHRYCIATFAPQLFEYPLASERKVAAVSPLGMGNPKSPAVPYARFDDVLSLPEAKAILHESRHLQNLFERRRLERAVRRRNLAPVLLALHFAAEAGAQ